MFRRLIALTAATGLIASGASAADFGALDKDASGSLSFAEIQAAAPAVTAEEFAAADIDGTGELSRDEFEAWKTASLKPTE